MDKEEFKGIILNEKERSLHISRVPKITKDAFVLLAEEEFCGDYGMCLKNLFDNFSLWKLLFENMDMKLDNIISIISKLENKEEKPEHSLTMLNGRKVMKGGIN